jgi:anti-sigma B factor antagonist
MSRREVSFVRMGRPPDITIAVAGELDLTTSPMLVNAAFDVLDKWPGTLALDLDGVPFIDSTAVSALVSIGWRARSTDWRLVLVNVRPQPYRVLHITGMLGALDVQAKPAA